jgi:hypothetical protein
VLLCSRFRPKQGSSVRGIIFDVDDREAAIFDLFEDTDYDKQVRGCANIKRQLL